MAAFIDLTGKRFGRLTVLSRGESDSRGKTRFNCLCDCGTPRLVYSTSLKNGDTVSCGCYAKDNATKTTFDNLPGQRFGRLVVVSRGKDASGGSRRYNCKCDCGNEKLISAYSLANGHTTSCGCLRKEQVAERFSSHGMSATPAYNRWANMIQRCTNPNSQNYGWYGGRGITVCDSWLCFENFYADMGDVPFEGAEIDRIDNEKGYSRENCRWTTHKINSRNTRASHRIPYNGQEIPLSEAAELLGVKKNALYRGASKSETREQRTARIASRLLELS